jgi:nucleoside-triphosphatase THEP1
MSNSSNSSKNLLLTGVPGCGKTTVAKRLAELLAGLRLAGFLTLELREHGQRVGFQAVGLGGVVPFWLTSVFARSCRWVVTAWSLSVCCR